MKLETPEQIITLRQSLKMSQRDFGQFIGRDSGLISKWETGKSPVPDYLTSLVQSKIKEAGIKVQNG